MRSQINRLWQTRLYFHTTVLILVVGKGILKITHLELPLGKYWFGTSRQGYDVFARSLFGLMGSFAVVVKGILNGANDLSITIENSK
jgi:ABC-type dipeptide/oligopeptide/nickel transport system permease subunit